jgi:hypothetical protein
MCVKQNGVHRGVPVLGPFFNRKSIFSVKATAFWQWINFLHARCPPEKHVVNINFDESPLPVWMASRPGLFKPSSRVRRQTFLKAEQKASLASRRARCSLLAFLADDEGVQRALPQIILSNRKIMKVDDYSAVTREAATTSRVFVMRRTSSWVNEKMLVEVLRIVSNCLEPFKSTRHFVFAMDSCPSHMTARVAAACARASLHLVYIPALLTPVLQPLDAYADAGGFGEVATRGARRSAGVCGRGYRVGVCG